MANLVAKMCSYLAELNEIMSFMHHLRSQLSATLKFLSKLPGFSKPERQALHFLNLSQFCGALNDNLYKFVLIFFLIRLEGQEHASTILPVAGAIFVIPFLLFSSFAGHLADKYSKSQLILWIKVSEIFIMALAIPFFAFKFKWGSYLLLFLLSTQSAFFSPSKYGILPEIVKKEHLSKANGLITSFTYLAIIIGTFLASLLTELFDYQFTWVALFCVIVAIIGFIASFGIDTLPAPKEVKQRSYPPFFRSIFRTLVACAPYKHLRSCLFISAYFLFIGAFTQLNVIQLALLSLHLPEWAGGYLFLFTALGIVCGSLVCGKFSKGKIEVGASVCATLFLALLFFAIAKVGHHLIPSLFVLFFLGFFGGMFIVPLEAFIQAQSPENLRGNVIAASNFFSFLGVLCASFVTYLFQALLKISPTESFLIIGWISLGIFFLLLFRFSDLFLAYTSRKIAFRCFQIKTTHLELLSKAQNPLLFLEESSLLKGWILAGLLPDIHFLVPQYKTRKFPWSTHLFYSLHRISSSQKLETLISEGKQFIREGNIPCIYLSQTKPVGDPSLFPFASFFKKREYTLLAVRFESTPGMKMIHFSPMNEPSSF